MATVTAMARPGRGRPGSGPGPDPTLEFLELRPRLVAVATRVLDSPADAEDVVQDAWLRWQRTDRATVVSPTAFLVATTARLAINAATSARVRTRASLERPLDELPDPVSEVASGPEGEEALEALVYLLLERLAPVERGAYVLREAFAYPYADIATVLGLSEVNARQVVSRAARRLRAGRVRAVGPVEHRRLVRAFLVAARQGDLAVLEGALRGSVEEVRDEAPRAA